MTDQDYVSRVAENGNAVLRSLRDAPLHLPAPVDLDELLKDPDILSRLPAPTEGEMATIGFMVHVADRGLKLGEDKRRERLAELKDRLLQALYGGTEPRQRYHSESLVLAIYHADLISLPACPLRQRIYDNRRLMLEELGLVKPKNGTA